MAAKVEDLPNSVAADANYPEGSGQDETTPGVSDDGTPLVAAIYNDIQGFFQSLLSKESITADGTPDTVLASQRRSGLTRTITRGGDKLDVSDTQTMTLGHIHRIDNSGGAVTVLLPNTGLYAGAVIKFSGDSPSPYSTNPVTFDAQAGETIGDTAQTVELTTDNLQGGFQRNEANTKWIPFKDRAFGTGL